MEDYPSASKLKRQQTTATIQVAKQRNKIVRMMTHGTSAEAVKAEMAAFDQLYDTYRTIHDALCLALDSEDAIMHEVDLFSIQEQETINLRAIYQEWTNECDPPDEPPDGLSQDYDTLSVASTASTARSARLREKADLAALLAERQLAQQHSLLLRRRQELEADETLYNLDVKIEKARARQQVFEEDDNEGAKAPSLRNELSVTAIPVAPSPSPLALLPPEPTTSSWAAARQAPQRPAVAYAVTSQAPTAAPSTEAAERLQLQSTQPPQQHFYGRSAGESAKVVDPTEFSSSQINDPSRPPLCDISSLHPSNLNIPLTCPKVNGPSPSRLCDFSLPNPSNLNVHVPPTHLNVPSIDNVNNVGV